MKLGFQSPLDLRAHAPGEWVVLRPLVFRAADGRVFTVPRGFVTDLASIPALVRPVLDQNGKSRRAAVLHDYLHVTQPVERDEADELFDEAMELDGEPWLSRTAMYVGVRLGGWVSWNKRARGWRDDDFVELSE